MFILRTVPIKRRLPDGELAYISKDKFKIGDIINVPLKKQTENVIVIECSPVNEAKEYIKSLPYRLVTIQDTEIKLNLDKKILKTIQDFSIYSLVPVDKIIRVFLSKAKFNKKDKIQNKIKIGTKESKPDQIYGLHDFLPILSSNLDQVKSLEVINPQGFSVYGQNYLDFDPIHFFVMLKNNLALEIIFETSYKRISYSEWKIKYFKEDFEFNSKVALIKRDRENKIDFKKPFTVEVENLIQKNTENKVLILSSGKNFSAKTVCGDCSSIFSCTKCDHKMVLVKNSRTFAKKHAIAGDYIYVCQNCGNAESSIVKCRNCDSWNLLPLGYGSERILENIESIIPKNKIFNQTESFSEKSYKTWQEKGGVMLCNLNFIFSNPKTDLLIVPALNAVLYNESFDSAEKAHELLNYAKINSKKTVFLINEDHEQELLETNLNDFIKEENKLRKTLHYPPYARFIKIKLDPYASRSPKICEAILNIVKKYSISDSAALNKGAHGEVEISASFDKNDWQIEDMNLKIAKKINGELEPFLKYIKTLVF